MMSLLRFAYVMAIGRAVSGWRLEAVLFGGVLLAVALMASGVIFSDLLSNAALRDALLRSDPEDVNFAVRSFSSRDDPPDVEGRSKVFRDRNSYVKEPSLNHSGHTSKSMPDTWSQPPSFSKAVLIWKGTRIPVQEARSRTCPDSTIASGLLKAVGHKPLPTARNKLTLPSTGSAPSFWV